MPDGRTVLIIAPDETARRSLRFLLEAEGFVVVDGQSGRGFGTVGPAPDCIVIDGTNGHIDSELAAGGRPLVLLVDELAEDQPAGRWLVQKPMLGEALIASVRAAMGPPRLHPGATT